MVKIFKQILFTLLVAATCFAINGQASSDTIQYPKRGEGTGEISGYAITNLQYHLAEDPTFISGVEFDLDGPAREVQVSFDSAPNLTFSCSFSSGYHWICELGQVKTGEVTKIHLSASG